MQHTPEVGRRALRKVLIVLKVQDFNFREAQFPRRPLLGSSLIVTFSNRCFPDKAVAVWLQLDDQGHIHLVEEYLREAGNFENIHSLDNSPRRLLSDPLYTVIGESTGACSSIDPSL